MLTKIKGHLAYYGAAALHTFWQAAVASLAGANIGSVLGADHLPQVSELQKIALAAAVAGGAAVLSYLKQLLVLVPAGSAPAIDTGVTAAEAAAADPSLVASSTPAAPETNGTASAG